MEDGTMGSVSKCLEEWDDDAHEWWCRTMRSLGPVTRQQAGLPPLTHWVFFAAYDELERLANAANATRAVLACCRGGRFED